VRTGLSPDNPFGFDRFGYAWEKIPRSGRRHLDFGCGAGRFLGSLRARGFERLAGIDASGEAIEAGRRRFPEIELLHRPEAVPLPFDDASFDSITLLEVLEHLHEQAAVLRELRRVLADDGALVLSVPRRHVFSFLDLGNFKFVFPRLHRWGYCLRHSRAEYERRYVANEDGLVGDISAAKRWHEHFTEARMAELLGQAGFRVVEFDGVGLFKRPLTGLRLALRWFPPARRVLNAMSRFDSRRFASSDLFCLAVKDPARGAR